MKKCKYCNSPRLLLTITLAVACVCKCSHCGLLSFSCSLISTDSWSKYLTLSLLHHLGANFFWLLFGALESFRFFFFDWMTEWLNNGTKVCKKLHAQVIIHCLHTVNLILSYHKHIDCGHFKSNSQTSAGCTYLLFGPRARWDPWYRFHLSVRK